MRCKETKQITPPTHFVWILSSTNLCGVMVWVNNLFDNLANKFVREVTKKSYSKRHHIKWCLIIYAIFELYTVAFICWSWRRRSLAHAIFIFRNCQFSRESQVPKCLQGARGDRDRNKGRICRQKWKEGAICRPSLEEGNDVFHREAGRALRLQRRMRSMV